MNYLQFLTENYIISEKNFEININEWRCGNPLWITGSSGDGKSTLANQITIENNAYLIHTDLFLGRICRPKEQYENMKKSTNGTINANGSEMVLEYINKHSELPWMADFRETGKIWNDFFNWILYNAKNNPKYRNKKIIIEGCDICLMPPEKACRLPLIIVGTSRLQASFRRIKRDQEDGKHTLIENIFRELKRHRAFIHELDTNKDNFKRNIKKVI